MHTRGVSKRMEKEQETEVVTNTEKEIGVSYTHLDVYKRQVSNVDLCPLSATFVLFTPISNTFPKKNKDV